MTDATTVPDQVQQDLFVLEEIPDCSLKEDVASMEFPLFSLSKNRDTTIRVYSRGGRFVRVIPSALGAATVFDKDLLIYCVSRLVRAADTGHRPLSRCVRVDIGAFLKWTGRSRGGTSYQRARDMFRRLRGTIVETNVSTNEQEETEGFGLIEDYRVVASTKGGTGLLSADVTLSEWLYRAVCDFNVLTLHPGYFALDKPLDRRLYELARKHCGDKAYWSITLPALHDKSGSASSPRRFRQDILEACSRSVAASSQFPEYWFVLDESTRPGQVFFFTRDSAKLHSEARKSGKEVWLSRFLQTRLALLAPPRPRTTAA